MQWDREAQSLRVLQGAGAPYLPSLEGCGVVTAGPPSVIGASALITARLGNPLHAHLRGGIPMDDRYVLLLAACLSAACCTLMVRLGILVLLTTLREAREQSVHEGAGLGATAPLWWKTWCFVKL